MVDNGGHHGVGVDLHVPLFVLFTLDDVNIVAAVLQLFLFKDKADLKEKKVEEGEEEGKRRKTRRKEKTKEDRGRKRRKKERRQKREDRREKTEEKDREKYFCGGQKNVACHYSIHSTKEKERQTTAE